MNFQSINAYLQAVSSSLNNADATTLAGLLSFTDPHVSNAKLQKESAYVTCQRFLENPYDELVAAHLKGCWALANLDYREAYSCQVQAVQTFVRIFQPQKDDNWSLPLMYTLILDLRKFANYVELGVNQLEKQKKGDTLEKAADTIMSCFRVCASDGRAAIEVSKKWGMLFLVNQLFKIYFRIGKLHLCKPLIRAIESSSIKDDFTLAQKVTYKYYVGRKAMFDSNFTQVKMLLGRLPSVELLRSHDLSQYEDIVKAVRTGNVHLLNHALLTNESFFIQTGVYLILEKLRATTFRTLFKRVSHVLGTHLIPLQAFTDALHGQGITDIDMDETECIVAGLIYAGNIRGYISHQHKKLVLSKVNAFPTVAS